MKRVISWVRRTWKAAALTLLVGALSYMLLMPRTVTDLSLPLPRVDRPLEQKRLAEERARAEAARRLRLPYSIRAVGESLRQFGRASAEADPRASRALLELRRNAKAALSEHGAARLLELRALQGELFLRALDAWVSTRKPNADLLELGGDIVDKIQQSQWLKPQSAEGQLQLAFSDNEWRTLFRLRWTKLTGLARVAAFAPTLNDYRLYYRALLLNPEGNSKNERLLNQLKYVTAMGRLDPSYEAGLAKGALLLRLGETEAARRELEAYLARKPRGDWTLRAQNYLRTAVLR